MTTMSRNSLIVETVNSFLKNYNPGSPPTPADIEAELVEQIRDQFEMVNATMLSKERKYKLLSALPGGVIAKIILALYPVACISLEMDSKILAKYCDSGEYEGLYVTKEDEIKRLIQQFDVTASEKEIADVYSKLERDAPLISLTKDRDLIPVNNGVFDYKSKQLLPFSPDMVFTSKSRVNYNPNAKDDPIPNPDGGKDWTVEDWMQSLSPDPSIVHLLWQLLGAVIRPNVPWNKSAWLYASSGNNGKGSLCVLMRGICGEGTYESISIRQFSKDVFLEPLTRISAVITDENQPGSYVECADNLKCAITGDPITCDRKYRSRLTFTFRGMVVQCFNEFPKLKDRTPSLLRRLLIIPMAKCFTGAERKYIKEDYLKRPEVLEYVLYKVLTMADYYELSEPQACKDELLKFQEDNDPVLQFWNEFTDKFVWDLLPFQFLYDLYKSWHKDNNPSGSLLSRNVFCRELKKMVSNDAVWEALKTPRAPGKMMSAPEPLIMKYGLAKWQNSGYFGTNTDIKCIPTNLDSTYRGFIRRQPQGSPQNMNGSPVQEDTDGR